MFIKFLHLLCLLVFMVGFSDSTAAAAPKDETVDDWIKAERQEHEETPAPTMEPLEDQSEPLVFPFFKMLAALAFVVLLIYALAKFLNKRTQAFSGSRSLESLGGISVGQNRSIQLVKVSDRILVIGVSDSIQLLKEIEDEKEIQKIIQERESALEQDLFAKSKQWLQTRQTAKSESFAAILEKQLKKMIDNRKNVYANVEKKESRDE